MRRSLGIAIILILSVFSAFGQDPNDCDGAVVVCDNGPVAYNPQGPGNNDLDGNSSTTCGTSEHQSAWYYFEFDNDMPPGLILEFTIFPDDGSDYDFAIWGPNVECGNLGVSIRCNFSPQGITGLVQGGGGPAFEEALIVNPGEGYYLLVDNFSSSSTGFSLEWGGTASDYLNCDADPNCSLEPDAGTDEERCPDDIFQLDGSFFGGNGGEIYEWVSNPASAINYLDDAFSLTPTVTLPSDFQGSIEYILRVENNICTRTDTVIVDLGLSEPPSFDFDFTLCEEDSPFMPGNTSLEGYTGTWSPDVIDPTDMGGSTITSTFTIDPGQGNCLESADFDFTIAESVMPFFSLPEELCESDDIFVFPTSDGNGITGTWNPASIDPSQVLGSVTSQFTPDDGQCATTTDWTLEVNESIVPTFDPIGDLCEIDDPIELPTTSLEGHTGSWNIPVIVPEDLAGLSVSIVFTPDEVPGLCLENYAELISIDPLIEPEFGDFGPLCELDEPLAFPPTSDDGFIGSWDQDFFNPQGMGGTVFTNVFTVDPLEGDCFDTYTAEVEVLIADEPTFDQVTLCELDDPYELPETSLNGITGFWTPDFIDPIGMGGQVITATFEPDFGLCALPFTMDIVIDAAVEPIFDPIGPFCGDDPAFVMPTSDLNGVTGFWNIDVIEPEVYEGLTLDLIFTPDNFGTGCLSEYSIEVDVFDALIPDFDIPEVLCADEAIYFFPSNSLNGIPGSWVPDFIEPSDRVGETVSAIFYPDTTIFDCAVNYETSIFIDELSTVNFDLPDTICNLDQPIVLPDASLGGVAGFWDVNIVDPSDYNDEFFVAIFSPANACYEPYTLEIFVNAPGTPVFSFETQYCNSTDEIITLPENSDNGIVGTWAPSAFEPGDYSDTSLLVTFFPNEPSLSCAASVDVNIDISAGFLPEFDPIGPLCETSAAIELDTISNNGIRGTWNFAVVDPSTLPEGNNIFSFTPEAGLCAVSGELNIEIIGIPEITSIAALDPSDCGRTDGQISLSASPDEVEYSLDGTSWQDTSNFVGLSGGFFTVSVRSTEVNACRIDSAVQLVTPNAPEIQNIVSEHPSDCGVNDGQIEIQVAEAGLEFSIDSGRTWQSENLFTDLAPGLFHLQIRNEAQSACLSSGVVTLLAPENTTLDSIRTIDVSGCVEVDGSIEVYASGNELEYSLNGMVWQSDNMFSGLPEGDYDIFVRSESANNCLDEGMTSITAPEQPVFLQIEGIDPSDCGVADGEISLLADVANVEYSIDGNSWITDGQFNGLEAGLYTVSVRLIDANSCSVDSNLQLVSPNAPSILSIEEIDPNDCGIDNGSIVISANGSDLEFSIDNGNSWQPQNTFTDLAAGMYEVVVRPAGLTACVANGTATLVAPIAPEIVDIELVQPSDCGELDAFININVVNTAVTLEYSIDGNSWQSDPIFLNVAPGVYDVQVRAVGMGNCLDLNTVEIIDPPCDCPVDEADVRSENVTCFDGSDGHIELIGVDTLPEVEIIWNTGPSTVELNNLVAGQYTYSIQYNTACLIEGIVEIIQPEALNFDVATEDADCPESPNGSLTLSNIVGGTAPYDVLVNDDVISGEMLTDLSVGDYDIIVRDANGCLSESSTVLVDSDASLFLTGQTNYQVFPGETVSMIVETGGVAYDNISWQSGGFEIAQGVETVDLTVGRSTSVLVTLSRGACSLQLIIQIDVMDIDIYVPNAFTPNDDGVNDVFKPESIQGVPLIVSKWQIFNRWGGKVFERSGLSLFDPDIAWDGTMNDELFDNAVFMWYLEAVTPTGEVIQLRGDVTLIR